MQLQPVDELWSECAVSRGAAMLRAQTCPNCGAINVRSYGDKTLVLEGLMMQTANPVELVVYIMDTKSRCGKCAVALLTVEETGEQGIWAMERQMREERAHNAYLEAIHEAGELGGRAVVLADLLRGLVAHTKTRLGVLWAGEAHRREPNTTNPEAVFEMATDKGAYIVTITPVDALREQLEASPEYVEQLATTIATQALQRANPSDAGALAAEYVTQHKRATHGMGDGLRAMIYAKGWQIIRNIQQGTQEGTTDAKD